MVRASSPSPIWGENGRVWVVYGDWILVLSDLPARFRLFSLRADVAARLRDFDLIHRIIARVVADGHWKAGHHRPNRRRWFRRDGCSDNLGNRSPDRGRRMRAFG